MFSAFGLAWVHWAVTPDADGFTARPGVKDAYGAAPRSLRDP